MIDSYLHASDWFLFFYGWAAFAVGLYFDERGRKKEPRERGARR